VPSESLTALISPIAMDGIGPIYRGSLSLNYRPTRDPLREYRRSSSTLPNSIITNNVSGSAARAGS